MIRRSCRRAGAVVDYASVFPPPIPTPLHTPPLGDYETLESGQMLKPGVPVTYPQLQPVVGLRPAPRFLSNMDFEGGKTTEEIHAEIAVKLEKEGFKDTMSYEAAVEEWELAFIRKHYNTTQNDLNNHFIQTACPGNALGPHWNFNTVWGWKWDHRRAPWHYQQYLRSPDGDGDSGRHPGGMPGYGFIEIPKIWAYEGWRYRRLGWKLWCAYAGTMWVVQYRDYIWDPTKEKGIQGYIDRRREGRFYNWWGFPGFLSGTSSKFFNPTDHRSKYAHL